VLAGKLIGQVEHLHEFPTPADSVLERSDGTKSGLYGKTTRFHQALQRRSVGGLSPRFVSGDG
jgi:hypothetical protein